MCCKGFAKRVLPFFLTFAVGLFIASFFVSIAAPNFKLPARSSKKKHREYDRQREAEIKQLRERNADLERQLAEKETDAVDFQNLKYTVPPVPPMPPAPPAPPTLRSVPRNDK